MEILTHHRNDLGLIAGIGGSQPNFEWNPVGVNENRVFAPFSAAIHTAGTRLVPSLVQYPWVVTFVREYLDRALRLGFREFWLCGAEVAACGRDAHLTYVWAVLSQDGAVPHDDSTTRIESPPESAPPAALSIRRRTPLSRDRAQSPTAPEVDPAPSPEPDQPPSPFFAQVETLRATLCQALQQTRELLATLKRQKQKPRLVESTLPSLRELRTSGS